MTKPNVIAKAEMKEFEQNATLDNYELYNCLWSLMSIILSNLPENNMFVLGKQLVEKYKIGNFYFGKGIEGDYLFDINAEKYRNLTPEDNKLNIIPADTLIKNLSFKWFDIKSSSPPEDCYFLALLYDYDFPAIIIREKNKYFMVIPMETTKDKKEIRVEVTKGVLAWTRIPPFITMPK